MKLDFQKIGPEELAEFRSHWNGRRVLDLIGEFGGKLLINWQIGVGKSHNIDSVVEEAARSKAYDLIIVLLPTRKVLDERKYILHPPPGIKVVNLRPRPVSQCEKERDKQWKVFEKQGMGLLGRRRICGTCPERQDCFWPDQYGKELIGARVIFATQSHLERDSTFLIQLRLWTGAEKCLFILDEVSFLSKKVQKQITRLDLLRFIEVLDKIE